MSSIETALQSIRRVVGKLGTAEAARLSGIPYTTLHEAKGREFVGRPIETFQKLAEFAEGYESQHGVQTLNDDQDAAA